MVRTVRQTLKRLNVKQADLARALALSQSTVSQKLSGSRRWRKDEIDAVLALLRERQPDLTYEQLFESAEAHRVTAPARIVVEKLPRRRRRVVVEVATRGVGGLLNELWQRGYRLTPQGELTVRRYAASHTSPSEARVEWIEPAGEPVDPRRFLGREA